MFTVDQCSVGRDTQKGLARGFQGNLFIKLEEKFIIHVYFFLLFISNSFFCFFPQGLIVSSRKDTLQHFKKPWAHEHKPIKKLIDAVKVSNLSMHLCNCIFIIWTKFLSCSISCFTFISGNQANRLDWNIRRWKNVH